MYKLMISDYTKSDTAISYEDGLKCLEKILEVINDNDNELIELDFQGINYVITAFLNPVIGDLIIQRGPDIMKKISISNANTSTMGKIKLVKDGALLKREDLEVE